MMDVKRRGKYICVIGVALALNTLFGFMAPQALFAEEGAKPEPPSPFAPPPAPPTATVPPEPPATAGAPAAEDEGFFSDDLADELNLEGGGGSVLDDLAKIQEEEMLIKRRIALERARQELEQLRNRNKKPEPRSSFLPVAPAPSVDAPDSDSPPEVATTSPSLYKIWAISGKKGSLRADLVTPEGSIISVKEGDPLTPSEPQGHKIQKITQRGVYVTHQRSGALYALPMTVTEPDNVNAITSSYQPPQSKPPQVIATPRPPAAFPPARRDGRLPPGAAPFPPPPSGS